MQVLVAYQLLALSLMQGGVRLILKQTHTRAKPQGSVTQISKGLFATAFVLWPVLFHNICPSNCLCQRKPVCDCTVAINLFWTALSIKSVLSLDELFQEARARLWGTGLFIIRTSVVQGYVWPLVGPSITYIQQ